MSEPASRKPAQTAPRAGATVDTRVDRSSETLAREVLQKVFETLRSLTPDGEIFIGHCSPLSHSCEVQWASGPFAPLIGHSVNIGTGPLSLALETDTPLEKSELGLIHPFLNQIIEGQAVAFRANVAGDALAIVCYWIPAEKGELSEERIEGLRSLIQLATMASTTTDLSLDVEAQKMHLESLSSEVAEVQRFYHHFSDAIRQSFWVTELESGRNLMVSENFERVWGSDRRVLQDGLTGWMQNVSPLDKDRVLSEFHIRLGQNLETELRVITKEGEERWIWLRAFPTDEMENTTSTTLKKIVFIADDITDKKTQEETIRSREADLISRAQMMAVGNLASGVAHEINNPLTVIIGKASEMTRLINKGLTDPKPLLEATEKIKNTSVRISEIIVSLKSMSRADKTTMQLSPFRKVIHDIKDLSSERLKSHGIELEVQEIPENLHIEMNATLVSQMIMNLVHNALDAVATEQAKWVKVEWAEDDQSVYVYVTDSGPGIPIAIRGRIFDPFFTTKDPGKGTGLGLSLAASIAAHHQGLIRLDTFHANTRFVIQLPKRQIKSQGNGGM